MSDILVSIVVPVYKTEKYLERCVSSLVRQTLKGIEIILVDDGSPDNSGIKCDYFAKTDSRIKVIHKANGGLSSARNAGLNAVNGKYVGFVDSDDDVEPDMYEKLALIAEQYQVDFVMSDYLRIEADGNRYIKTISIEEGLYTKERINKDIFPSLIMGENIDYGPLLSVCHCLYRREFLARNHIRFDEQVRWSEDNIFSACMGYHANSFYYLKNEALYHYYQNPGTITTAFRQGAWGVYCTMNDHLHSFFDNVTDYEFSRQLKLHMIYYACNCLSMAAKLAGASALAEIRNILNDDHLIKAFRDFRIPKVHLKLRIQLILMKYRMAYPLYVIKRWR